MYSDSLSEPANATYTYPARSDCTEKLRLSWPIFRLVADGTTTTLRFASLCCITSRNAWSPVRGGNEAAAFAIWFGITAIGNAAAGLDVEIGIVAGIDAVVEIGVAAAEGFGGCPAIAAGAGAEVGFAGVALEDGTVGGFAGVANATVGGTAAGTGTAKFADA